MRNGKGCYLAYCRVFRSEGINGEGETVAAFGRDAVVYCWA